MTTNICKTCGTIYETEDLFNALFGAPAPANSNNLCPECEAAWLDAHKDCKYEGE